MGKDTAAKAFRDLLVAHYPDLKVECRAFADPIYEECHKLWGWDGFRTKEYYDQHPEEKNQVLPHIGKTPRALLIELGTRVREVYKDTWVQYLTNLCPPLEQRMVLITDVRTPKEYDAVKQASGFCVRVTRPGVALHEDALDTGLEHEAFDWNILNQGSPQELGVQVWVGLERWLYHRDSSILKWLCTA